MEMLKILRGRRSGHIYVVISVLFILLLINTNLFMFTRSAKFIYFVKPFLWLCVAWLVFSLPQHVAAGRLSLGRLLRYLALGSALVYFLILMTAGLLQGFGRSPYSFAPMMILLNLYYVVSYTLGAEAARAYLINGYKGKRVFLIVGLLSIFFTLPEVSFTQIQSIKTLLEGMKYVGGTFSPFLAQSIVASYFAYLGGPVPAMFYHGLLLVLEWFCPILPDLNWLMKAFLGCLVPVFSLLFVQHLYLLQARELKRTTTDSAEIFGWLLTSIFSVLLIWFAVGLFPLYPSVIATGSMEPLIKPGDVVLMRKITGDKVKTGDIIQYFDLEEEIHITHRVISTKGTDKKKLQTKGDNNLSIDAELVLLEQVEGEVVAVIPKIGWLTLLLRSKGGFVFEESI